MPRAPHGPAPALRTPRLELRPPRASDRARFLELFGDPAFMVFSDGVLDERAAGERFDRMLARAAELTFAKQPVIERSSGLVIGYVGVDRFPFEGEVRLEMGWRLVPDARGRGYATEAAGALLARAAETYRGEILAIIDPRNEPSARVARKLGFTWWKRAEVNGYVDDLYRLQVGPGGEAGEPG